MNDNLLIAAFANNYDNIPILFTFSEHTGIKIQILRKHFGILIIKK